MQIIKSNITQQVIEYLKENIENKTWAVHQKIPSEFELTEMLGVSRGSVRMAIRQLIALDILESHQGKGTFVKQASVSGVGRNLSVMTADDSIDISKILEFRNILEPEATFLAVKKSDQKLVEILTKLLSDMKSKVGSPEAFVDSDLKFHKALCHASENPLIEDCLFQVFSVKHKRHEIMTEAYGYNDAIYFHTQLLQAVKAQDAIKARKIMKEHIQQAADRLNNDQSEDTLNK